MKNMPPEEIISVRPWTSQHSQNFRISLPPTAALRACLLTLTTVCVCMFFMSSFVFTGALMKFSIFQQSPPTETQALAHMEKINML